MVVDSQQSTKPTPFSGKPPTGTVEHVHSIPLPNYLSRELTSTKLSSLMGLLPEAKLAWMSVDEKLYVWSYEVPFGDDLGVLPEKKRGGGASVGRSEDFCSFNVPSGQCVVSVGLVKPKKGVFKEVVKWCLVVSTPEEVLLCALATTDISTPSQNSSQSPSEEGFGPQRLRLIPTRFIIPTDSVPILKIAGTPTGRIFLAGANGCLYEMIYEGLGDDISAPIQSAYAGGDNRRYNECDSEDMEDYPEDTSGVLSSVSSRLYSGSKRALYAIPSLLFSGEEGVLGSGSTNGGNRRKCRKINHSQGSIWSAIMPGFVMRLTSAVVGGGLVGGGGASALVDMVVDQERHCVYTLSANGFITTYDLGPDGLSAPRVASTLDAAKICRRYVEAVSRSQMYFSSNNIVFAGGGQAATRGLGGMNSARMILKMADHASTSTFAQNSDSKSAPGILHPVRLHVISKRESKSLTLLAVTGGGVRLYLSNLALSNAPPGIYRADKSYTPPSHKMTLCHVRAPPPLDILGNWRRVISGGGGCSPGILLNEDGIGRTGGRKGVGMICSHYQQGVFVMGLEGEGHAKSISFGKTQPAAGTIPNSDGEGAQPTTGEGAQPTTGDVLVASVPDCARRPVDDDGMGGMMRSDMASPSHTNRTLSTSLHVPGGISECVSLPFSSQNIASPHVLPGGRLWEITGDAASHVHHDLGLLNRLFFQSSTPSDFVGFSAVSDRSVTLPPAFVPRVTRVRRVTPETNGTQTPSSSTTPRQGGVISSTFAFLVGSTKSDGGYISSLTNIPTPPRQTYKLEHNWKRGFLDSSAAPKANLTRTGRRKSISKTSTKPSFQYNLPNITPLTQLSTQFISSSSSNVSSPNYIVALNSGGLHFFRSVSVLGSFSQILKRSHEKEMELFFQSYGNPEGCAMALFLAVNASNEGMKTKAKKAALMFGLRPRMVNTPLALQNETGSTIHDSSGYTFQPSALHDGVELLLSRLLRPIWCKPAIICTEPKTLRTTKTQKVRGKRMYISSQKTGVIPPAKVEMLLDETTLEEIRKPLYALQILMKEMFSPAISVVPGSSTTTGEGDAMDVDNDSTRRGVITGALQFQRDMDNAGNQGHNGVSPRTPRDLELEARTREEQSLHRYYRLVSRTTQLLSLLSLLRRAHFLPTLPEVEWGLLNGLTFHQLVCTCAGQERVTCLISALVSADAHPVEHAGEFAQYGMDATNDADKLADSLSEQSYLYFSQGDRLAYQGFQAARAALGCGEGSVQRTTYGNRAAVLLRRAARHWTSPRLVSGSLTADDNYNAESSPLARASNALSAIGHVGGIVDVCLSCAANFGGSIKGTASEDDVSPYQSGTTIGMNSTSPPNGMLSWETGLYRNQARNDKTSGISSTPTSIYNSEAPSTPQSLFTTQGGNATNSTVATTTPRSIVATSTTEAAPSDARNSCYSILLHHLEQYLSSGTLQARQSAEEMLSVASASQDSYFLQFMFEFLLRENHVETLLRISSDTLEQWLKQRDDYELLWRYHLVHERHDAACEVTKQRAMDEESTNITLDERIVCLTRAINSAGAGGNRGSSYQSNARSVEALAQTRLQELLDVASLQKRVLLALSDDQLSYGSVDKEVLEKLGKKLLNVSDLYNEYAAPFCLYEICLSILLCCQCNDAENIDTLWKTIIGKELPPNGQNARVDKLLKGIREGTPLAEGEENNNGSGDDALFRSGDWIGPVKSKVVALGKELYGKGADYTFPLPLLVMILEGLRSAFEAVHISTSNGGATSMPVVGAWPFFCFLEVGVPYPSILDAYSSLLSAAEREGADPDERLHYLKSISEILTQWIRASSNIVGGGTSVGPKDSQENSGVQLARSLSGGLRSSIDSFKASLEALVGGNASEVSKILSHFSEIESALASRS